MNANEFIARHGREAFEYNDPCEGASNETSSGIEPFFARISSPFTAVVGGTWGEMKKRDFDPLKGDFNPFSGLDAIKGTIALVVAIIVFIILLPTLLTLTATYKKQSKGVKRKK